MKTTIEKISDKQLLSLLDHDPHEGMAAAIAQFTGILWCVAECHLQNPEDIKECINDTFMEFYLHRDRYEPKKGSLTTYLSQIVRNLSTSRYRKNVIRSACELPEDIPEPRDFLNQVEDQSDLEQAISALKPRDADIIRMKYYNGMSVREIADSLGLPYESVKKRHQRSLGKLKLLLLGLLLLVLLAALAACAYAALRYFGIVPGYGISYSPDAQVYLLEEPVTVENEMGTFFIDSAMLLNGSICIQMDFYPNDPDILWDVTKSLGLVEEYRPFLMLNGGASWLPLGAGETPVDDHLELTLEVGLPEELSLSGDVMEAAFRLYGQDFSICLNRVQAQKLSSYVYQTGSWGGLLAIPRLEGGRLIVSIYPLHTGEATVQYNLLRGAIMEGKVGDVTAIGSDGTERVGEFIPSSAIGTTIYFADWDFGPAEPGEYTIHVPYVYLSVPMEPVTIPLDLEGESWEQEEYPVPGGTLSLVSCQPLELAAGETIPESGKEILEDCSYWTLRMRYTSENLVLTWCYPEPSSEMETNRKTLEEIDTSGSSGMIHVIGDGSGGIAAVTVNGFNTDFMGLGPEEDELELLLWGYDGFFDPSNVILTLQRPLSLRWDYSFDLPLLVEEEN